MSQTKPPSPNILAINPLAEEGYVKFDCQLTPGSAPKLESISDLMGCREYLYKINLIGMYPDGIGFGNISKRFNNTPQFIISGTQTGGISPLKPEHFVTITNYDFKLNQVQCSGIVKASSETLTHAAVYESDPNICAVAHVHSNKLWTELLNKVPTTSAEVTYGTPEMAGEIKRLFENSDVRSKQVIAMAGHQDGIIFFGKNFEEIRSLLRDFE